MPENKRIGFGAGDKVALRCSATMTHRGDHLGMPATGKSVRLTGISITRIVKGKIIRRMGHWDQLGMLEQLGVCSRPKSRLRKSA
jgi:predicted ester cyclase